MFVNIKVLRPTCGIARSHMMFKIRLHLTYSLFSINSGIFVFGDLINVIKMKVKNLVRFCFFIIHAIFFFFFFSPSYKMHIDQS